MTLNLTGHILLGLGLASSLLLYMWLRALESDDGYSDGGYGYSGGDGYDRRRKVRRREMPNMKRIGKKICQDVESNYKSIGTVG